MDFSKLQDVFLNNDSFLLTTHVNPDADAIGSEIAVYYVLKQLGKNVRIVNFSATPYNLEFLDEEKIIEQYDPLKHARLCNQPDVLLALDMNNANRIITMKEGWVNSRKYKACIDHHQDPAPDFADLIISDPLYAATSHILYDFIAETKLAEIDKRIAAALYAGIMTDTGSFRFNRTTPELHLLTAELLLKGADPTHIYDQIYDQSNPSKIQLLGEALANIEMHHDNRIASITITKEALERTGADESEVDGFVNYCLSIKGVEIGLLFFEMEDGVKISFRSKGNISVNKLAEQFNGGGHKNASGARLTEKNLEHLKQKIIGSAVKYLE